MPPKRTRQTTLPKLDAQEALEAPGNPKKKALRGRKRKTGNDSAAGPDEDKIARPRKTQKKAAAMQTQISETSADKLEKPIVINRAPVLELWGACVAHFLHPSLKWSACLSIGSSIATITAISKGRAIGLYEKPDREAEEERRKREKVEREGLSTVKVMGFPMTLQDDAVLFKGRLRPGREASLARRFGEEDLARVKSTMMDALETWRGREDELDRKAFHMYEQFRPQVARGQRGWGMKGELRLPEIKNAVRR